jgi:uncharacterized tellurite resistance protein B-like protein
MVAPFVPSPPAPWPPRPCRLAPSQYDARMPLARLKQWLGIADDGGAPEHTPLRELVEALDRLEPERAKQLARFAYLLGRVAHADRNTSADETRAMEGLVRDQGQISADQAMLVVSLAKTSNLMFGGTADYLIAKEFADSATYEEKLALARCLFSLAATDQAISMAEETEIHRITTQLRIQPEDLTSLRVEHRQFLPGLAGKPPTS